MGIQKYPFILSTALANKTIRFRSTIGKKKKQRTTWPNEILMHFVYTFGWVFSARRLLES